MDNVQGDRKLKITGLVYKKPRLLPNDNFLFLVDNATELDGLIQCAKADGLFGSDGVSAFKASVSLRKVCAILSSPAQAHCTMSTGGSDRLSGDHSDCKRKPATNSSRAR